MSFVQLKRKPLATVISFLIYSFFSLNFCIAQPNNTIVGDVVMPAPNVGALGKYGDIPVSLHTGTANVSVPIHTVTDGNLSLPISLNYHSSGIRVGETASWVGIGWALQAGGVISRTTQGLDDDKAGFGFYHFSANGLQSNASPYVKLPFVQGQRDPEPDVFSFNVAGYSGKFFFDHNRDIHLVPKQDVKIKTNFDISGYGGVGVFKQFIVITPDGTKYFFGQDPTDANRIAWEFSRSTGEGVKATASSWYLVRIESHDGKNAIELFYDNEQYSYQSPANREYQHAFFALLSPTCGSINNGVKPTSLPGHDAYHHYVKTHIQGKRLSQIVSSTCNVNFNVNPSYFAAREDLGTYMSGVNTSKKLDNIEITSGSYCSKFTLNHSYYEDNITNVGNTFFEPYKKRLKLLSVQQSDCVNSAANTIPPYVFDYENEVRGGVDYLPHRLNKGVDHWGFYNGADGSNNFVANNENFITNIPPTTVLYEGSSHSYGSSYRDSDFEYAKLGSLKKITYPTGGHTEIIYEANSYLGEIPDGPPNTVIDIKNTPCVNYNGSNPPPSNCCGTYDMDHVDMIYDTDRYTFSSIDQIEDMQFRLYLAEGCNSNISAKIDVYHVTGSNEALAGTMQIVESNEGMIEDQWHLLSELETISPFSANEEYRFELTIVNGVGAFELKEFPTTIGSKSAGGLRIKQIRSHDGISTNNDIIKTYDYVDENGAESGQLYFVPRYGTELNFLGDCELSTSAGFPSYTTSQIIGALFFDQSYVPLADFDGKHIGYTHVKESLNGNGYKTYEYLQDIDFIANYQPYPAAPKRYQPKNGKESVSKSFSQTNSSVSQTNTHAHPYSLITTIPTTYKFSSPVNASSYTDPLGALPITYSLTAYLTTSYQMQTSVYRVEEIVESIDGVSSSTLYDYDYNYDDGDPTNDHYFPTSISRINSDGKTFSDHMEYPFDYSANVHIKMVERNMIATPLRITKKVDGQTVDGQHYIYGFFQSNGFPGGSETDPIYLKEVERYERTWDSNGTLSGNWDSQGIILRYDMAVGKPSKFQQDGWDEENYTWDLNNKQIRTRNYDGFTWTYDYFSGTNLLKEIIDIDGQDTDFAYDQLMRLDSIIAKDRNVITTFDYVFTNGTEKNHVKTHINFKPSSPNSQLSWQESWEYLDGLGRHLQTVKRHYGPNEEDIVTDAVAYDNQGRVVKAYESFVGGNNTGAFTDPSGEDYTFSEYYDDPLSRIHKVTPPDWHTTTYEYGTNPTTLYDIGVGFNYPANTLFINTVIDPNGNKTIAYQDKRGRAIMNRRTNSSGSEKADTKFKYDDKDRQRFVYPPGAFAATTGLFFKYLYDGEDNLIEKTIPDVTNPHKYLYDDRNLLVASQNPILQGENKWLVSQHDNYGRITNSGYYNGISISDPNNVTISTPLTETFYDETSGATGSQYIGKVRKTRVKQLNHNTTDDVWQEEEFTYDIHGRVELSVFRDHLDGIGTKSFVYDWADNMTLESCQYTSSNISSLGIVNEMHYDHSGRRIDYYKGIGNNADVHISNMKYNHKDLLIEKNLGGVGSSALQSIDYVYNAQNWLTMINNPNQQGFASTNIICNEGIGSSSIATKPTGSSSTAGTLTSTNNDLFSLLIRYDNPNNAYGPGSENGNISELVWQIKGRTAQSYGFNYDYLDRLTASTHASYPQTISSSLQLDRYYDTSYEYKDARGNFDKLTRKGLKWTGDCFKLGTIDDLQYGYQSNSNQIQSIIDNANEDCPTNLYLTEDFSENGVFDADNLVTAINTVTPSNGGVTYQGGNGVSLTAGFKADGTNGDFKAQAAPCDDSPDPNSLAAEGFLQTTTDAYQYDPAGNMTRDPHKKITIHYNHLNLPYKIVWDNGNRLEFEYDASGVKLQKKVFENGNTTPIEKRDYVRGTEYKDNILEAVYHEEGRFLNKGDNNSNLQWEYQYNLKDHLGNTRLMFADQNNNGTIEAAEQLQEHHYYPFGLEQNGDWNNNISASKSLKYLYNGKEFNDDFGLNWMDYGARFYDAAMGRWNVVDPLADKFYGWSPYNYTYNDPISFIDPDGTSPEWCVPCLVALGNFAKGAAVEASTQVVFNMAKGQGALEAIKNIDGFDVVASGVEDVLSGGTSSIRKAVVSVASEIAQASVDIEIDGDKNIIGSEGSDKTIGGVITDSGAALFGKKVGEATEGGTKMLANSKVNKELSKAKIFEKNAATGSKLEEVAKGRIKNAESTIKGNNNAASTIGHFAGETTEEKVKN